jgi:Flavodoxin-like fold
VAGKTFRYTAQSPEGLAGGKRVVIASSRSGVYSQGSPYASLDFQENYLRAVLAFSVLPMCKSSGRKGSTSVLSVAKRRWTRRSVRQRAVLPSRRASCRRRDDSCALRMSHDI